MAPTVCNVELLIAKATNLSSRNDDPNIMQKIGQAVVTEPLGVQTAIRLLAQKIQSPQEHELVQTLLILQSCVNNCGKVFHSEVGKFRFLNEMIKVVSPNYLGNRRPHYIKKRICELLYTWTIDIPHETKIAEAYQMLKNQRIIQEDPAYLGVSLTPAENKAKIIIKDEEKSKHLQELLQSKKPEDVLEANALIKKIVKDDERHLERSTRRSIEVETALNNASVLDEMIHQYELSPGGKADLDLMSELNDSCASIQTNIYRLVADLHENEEGIGKLLKANDELSLVMGRYKLKIKDGMNSNSVPTTAAEQNLADEETLLDLNPQIAANVKKEEEETKELNIGGPENIVNMEEKLDLISILDDPISALSPLDSNCQAISSLDSSFPPQILIPEKSYQASIGDDEILKTANCLNDIDLLGSSVIRHHLPPNSCQLGSQFKSKEKVSMNQLKSQQIEASQTNVVASNRLSDLSSFHFGRKKSENDSDPAKLSDINIKSTLNFENVLTDSSTNHNQQFRPITSESGPIRSSELSPEAYGNEANEDKKSNSVLQPESKCNINDIDIQLADIIPDESRSPMEIIDRNLMKVSVYHTLNKQIDDTVVLVITTVSSHPTPVSNYNLHVICPEGCSVRLMTPSSTTFPAFKPFLPSPVITQILLFVNPNQVTDDALRLILKYKVGEKTQADYGEVDLTAS